MRPPVFKVCIDLELQVAVNLIAPEFGDFHFTRDNHQQATYYPLR